MKNKRNDDKIPWTANLSELCFCFSLVYLPHNFTHVWLVLPSSLSAFPSHSVKVCLAHFVLREVIYE